MTIIQSTSRERREKKHTHKPKNSTNKPIDS